MLTSLSLARRTQAPALPCIVVGHICRPQHSPRRLPRSHFTSGGSPRWGLPRPRPVSAVGTLPALANGRRYSAISSSESVRNNGVRQISYNTIVVLQDHLSPASERKRPPGLVAFPLIPWSTPAASTIASRNASTRVQASDAVGQSEPRAEPQSWTTKVTRCASLQCFSSQGVEAMANAREAIR